MSSEPAPLHPLDRIFRPGSVAVVGASVDPRKRGHQALLALRAEGFAGSVFPVNPKGGEILGLAVHESVEALPSVPDLALVCTPAHTVPEVVETCGRRGVGGAVILAVGFAESGGEGRRLEGELRAVSRATGIRVVGPNTSGILNAHAGLDLIGVGDVPRGDVGLLVQSGNVALSLLNEIRTRGGRGVSICASVGNEAGIRFHEYLEYLDRDPETRVVAVYAEGFADPRAFLATAARVRPRLPVVLLKGGRSDPGREAARSHTGAVSGSYALLRAGLGQAGVVEVRRSDELLPVAEALAAAPAPASGEDGAGVARAGGRLAILSDGGGQGTLAADALAEEGVAVASLTGDTRARLRELLGRAAAVTDPVDLAGRADAEPGVFASALELLARDPAVGTILVVGLFGGYHLRFAPELETAELEAARSLARGAADAGVGLVVHSMYASSPSRPLDALRREGVPVVGSLEAACRAARAIEERRARPGSWEPEEWSAVEEGPARVGDAHRAVGAARGRDDGALTEPEARRLVGAFGIETPRGRVCASASEARETAAALGGRLVAKVVSAGIPHKTEAGGVLVGLGGEAAAAQAWKTLMERGRRHLRDTDVGTPDEPEGVLVCEMLGPPVAELLVGVRRDPGLGPVATVGLGGTGVEVLGDVAHRVLPVGREQVLAMLDELRIAPLLRGHRGRPGIHRDAVARVVLGLARCLRSLPDLRELEANPVFAYPGRAVAVDVRAYLDPEASPRG